jgi:hypothetical protein
MYFEPFWEGNAVNTGVPCLKVPMHRKLRLEDASHDHRPSTWASAASASRRQHVIAMAREVLRGWGARPMRSLAQEAYASGPSRGVRPCSCAYFAASRTA